MDQTFVTWGSSSIGDKNGSTYLKKGQLLLVVDAMCSFKDLISQYGLRTKH